MVDPLDASGIDPQGRTLYTRNQNKGVLIALQLVVLIEKVRDQLICGPYNQDGRIGILGGDESA